MGVTCPLIIKMKVVLAVLAVAAAANAAPATILTGGAIPIDGGYPYTDALGFSIPKTVPLTTYSHAPITYPLGLPALSYSGLPAPSYPTFDLRCCSRYPRRICCQDPRSNPHCSSPSWYWLRFPPHKPC